MGGIDIAEIFCADSHAARVGRHGGHGDGVVAYGGFTPRAAQPRPFGDCGIYVGNTVKERCMRYDAPRYKDAIAIV